MRAFWILMLAAGCAGTAEDKDTDTTDTTDDTDTVDTDVEVVDDTLATLTGSLLDASGAAITESLRVQYCRNTACRAANIDGNTYSIEGIEPGAGSFEVIGLGDDSTLATVFAPLSVGEGEVRTVDVTVPDLENILTIPATAAELQIADGLYLTVGQGDLSAPSPLDPAATTVGAVNALDMSLPIEGLPGEVLALYYVSPFDYHSDAPLPIRIRNDWSLESGDADLYLGVYETFSWERIDSLDDDGGGSLVLSTTGGVELITTIAVVRATP